MGHKGLWRQSLTLQKEVTKISDHIDHVLMIMPLNAILKIYEHMDVSISSNDAHVDS